MGKDKKNAQNYWSLFRRNAKESGGEFIVARLTEHGVRRLPAAVILQLGSLFGNDFLNNTDVQKDTAKALGTLFGNAREDAEVAFIELFEEVAKINRQAAGDPDKLDALWANSKLTRAKAAPENKPTAPKQDKVVLQAVGELTPAQQEKFWAIVDRLQRKLNGGQANQPNIEQPGDEITRLINRMKISKEQLLAMLAARPESLQEDLLLHALRQSTSADGVAGGFQRFFDRAQSLLERAMEGMESNVNVSDVSDGLKTINDRWKIEDDDVSGIR